MKTHKVVRKVAKKVVRKLDREFDRDFVRERIDWMWCRCADSRLIAKNQRKRNYGKKRRDRALRFGAIVIDSSNSDELSDFYQRLLGWEKECQYFEGEKWYIVKNESGEEMPLVFQEVETYERPVWPSVKGFQQQMQHLDFYVQAEDYDTKVSHAISCGAEVSEIQLTDSLTVMLDPAGHPFCIIPLPSDV